MTTPIEQEQPQAKNSIEGQVVNFYVSKEVPGSTTEETQYQLFYMAPYPLGVAGKPENDSQVVLQEAASDEEIKAFAWRVEDAGSTAHTSQVYLFTLNAAGEKLYAYYSGAERGLTVSKEQKTSIYPHLSKNGELSLAVHLQAGGGYPIFFWHLQNGAALKIGGDLGRGQEVFFTVMATSRLLSIPTEGTTPKRETRSVTTGNNDHDQYPEHIKYADPEYVDVYHNTWNEQERQTHQAFYQKFAPLVHFANDGGATEDNFPSSVDWFLNKTRLRKRYKKQGYSKEQQWWYKTIKNHPTGKDLRDYSESNEAIPSPAPYSHPYHDSVIDFSIFLEETDSGTSRKGMSLVDGQVSSDVPTYLNPRILKDENGNATTLWDLEYFFFYPYNGRLYYEGDTVGKHVGDWERVCVRVDKAANNGEGQVIAVCFKGHEGDGTWYKVDHHNHVEFEGTHPVVYAAYHSHANYNTAGEQVRGTWYTLWVLPNDFTGKGVRWETWNNVQEVNYRLPDMNNQEWIRFNGIWGDTDGIITQSPDGPSCKTDFFRGFKDDDLN